MWETNSNGFWFDAFDSYFENEMQNTEMQNTEVTLNYFEISPMLINLIYFFMYSTLLVITQDIANFHKLICTKLLSHYDEEFPLIILSVPVD